MYGVSMYARMRTTKQLFLFSVSVMRKKNTVLLAMDIRYTHTTIACIASINLQNRWNTPTSVSKSSNTSRRTFPQLMCSTAGSRKKKYIWSWYDIDPTKFGSVKIYRNHIRQITAHERRETGAGVGCTQIMYSP